MEVVFVKEDVFKVIEVNSILNYKINVVQDHEEVEHDLEKDIEVFERNKIDDIVILIIQVVTKDD